MYYLKSPHVCFSEVEKSNQQDPTRSWSLKNTPLTSRRSDLLPGDVTVRLTPFTNPRASVPDCHRVFPSWIAAAYIRHTGREQKAAAGLERQDTPGPRVQDGDLKAC